LLRKGAGGVFPPVGPPDSHPHADVSAFGQVESN
jgi:hypothetical protein